MLLCASLQWPGVAGSDPPELRDLRRHCLYYGPGSPDPGLGHQGQMQTGPVRGPGLRRRLLCQRVEQYGARVTHVTRNTRDRCDVT